MLSADSEFMLHATPLHATTRRSAEGRPRPKFERQRSTPASDISTHELAKLFQEVTRQAEGPGWARVALPAPGHPLSVAFKTRALTM